MANHFDPTVLPGNHVRQEDFLDRPGEFFVRRCDVPPCFVFFLAFIIVCSLLHMAVGQK